MDCSEITPEFLKKKLIEKHKNFINEYKQKLDDMQRLFVLEEKIDQLSHWIEKDSEQSNSQLISNKHASETELEELKSRLGVFSDKKITEVKEKIREHEEALNHFKKE
jgi:F0F1-type ATP synthase delta subunit